MKIITIDKLKEKALSPGEFIRECESAYENTVTETARALAEGFEQHPIVLLAGPSGSGKTSTAKKLCKALLPYGIKGKVISMDNYFLPGRPAPSKDGKIDYEKPDRVDSALLSQHMRILAGGGEITMPSYDFEDNTRSDGEKFTRDKNTLIILEGIHALNPDVTGALHEYSDFIYVSVRTRIADETGVLLHPSKIRLIRRMCRDKLFRGRDYHETIAGYQSVQRGENMYIMPYKHLSRHDIDTFFGYELFIYAGVLREIREDFNECEERNDMYSVLPRFLNMVEPLSPDLVPENSILREFIG